MPDAAYLEHGDAAFEAPVELHVLELDRVIGGERDAVAAGLGGSEQLGELNSFRKIYAQVSEEPDVLRVYEDLFAEEGCEVYLKAMRLFLQPRREPISFGELTVAGLMRSESVFGVRIMAEESDAGRNNGIYLDPPKNQRFTLGPDDCLITLAENET